MVWCAGLDKITPIEIFNSFSERAIIAVPPELALHITII